MTSPNPSRARWPWWLILEHGALACLIGWRALDLWRTRQKKLADSATDDNASASAAATSSTAADLAGLPKAALAAISRLKALAGSREVLEWPGVHEAPGASMDMSGKSDGEVVTYRDGRGAIYKFKVMHNAHL